MFSKQDQLSLRRPVFLLDGGKQFCYESFKVHAGPVLQPDVASCLGAGIRAVTGGILMSWHEHISNGTTALVKADYYTAREELKRALMEAKIEFSDGDQRTLHTLVLLGQAYYKEGFYAEAEPLFQALAESSPDEEVTDRLSTAVALFSLAQINKQTGKTADASRRYQQAVVLLKSDAGGGESHADTVAALEQLLCNVTAMKHGHQPAQHFRDLLRNAHSQRNLPSAGGHRLLDQWQKCIHLGSEYLDGGDSEERTIAAYQQLLTAAKLSYRLFPHDHSNIAKSLDLLAQVSNRTLMHDQAEALFKRAAGIYASHPQCQMELAEVKFNMSKYYEGIHEYRLAVTQLVEAAELMGARTTQPDRVYSLALSMITKADLYASARELVRQAIECEESDRLEQACHLYDDTLALMKRVFGDHHPEVAQMLKFKANVLRRLGQSETASKVECEADAIDSLEQETVRAYERYVNLLQPFRIPPSRSLPD